MKLSEKYFAKYISEQDYPNQLNTLRYGEYCRLEGLMDGSLTQRTLNAKKTLQLMAKEDNL